MTDILTSEEIATLSTNLRFPEINQVIVRFDDDETDTLNFESPLSEEDHKDIQWYLEVYAAQYTTECSRAEVSKRLERW